ncbi:redoxin domain-containing protein [Paenibacillus sediminis]|uniref:Peroxiredoxin n=1 Tax=Paenibacillus sediminis TaxID=664909 RepID=A0ABS4GZL8_9BACL|nr:redoxin domain-containing protein [Paenibacillus sediminis]MBP1935723.1 peroxiredoxin [Paenibacillus sediminis]
MSKSSRRTIQILILIAIVILGGYAIGSAVLGSDGKLEAGDKSPSFALLGTDGAVHKLEDYKGKALVINFFGTWCEPCVKEMPALQSEADKWKDQGVAVIGINAGEDQMTVENFVDGLGIKFPILLDEDKDAINAYHVVPLPTTIFVKPDGRISAIHLGQLDLQTLDSQIAQLVKQ